MTNNAKQLNPRGEAKSERQPERTQDHKPERIAERRSEHAPACQPQHVPTPKPTSAVVSASAALTAIALAQPASPVSSSASSSAAALTVPTHPSSPTVISTPSSSAVAPAPSSPITPSSAFLTSPVKPRLLAQINSYLDYCATTRQMSRWTIYNKVATFRNLIAETKCKSLERLTNEDFDRFIKAELQRGLRPSSINQKTANVIAMVRYHREMGLHIPLKIPFIVKLRERPTPRLFYTREQIRRVLRRCQSELQWLLIRVAFDTGMRIAELTNLSLSQMRGRRINFIGKGTKAREVYICEDTYCRLRRYVAERHICDRLWLNRWGYPLAVSSVRRIMKDAFVRCGYPDFHPHALRHSFGSDIQRRGADIMVIREMMGHSSVATTQRYLHGFEGQLEALFKRYKG